MNKEAIMYRENILHWPLLRSKVLQILKSKTNELSKLRRAQSVSQDPFKMGKRKPKLMNGQSWALEKENIFIYVRCFYNIPLKFKTEKMCHIINYNKQFS